MEIDGVGFTVLWKYLYCFHYTLQRFMVEYFKVCMYILQQYKLNKNMKWWHSRWKAPQGAQAYKDPETLGIWPKSLLILAKKIVQKGKTQAICLNFTKARLGTTADETTGAICLTATDGAFWVELSPFNWLPPLPLSFTQSQMQS